MVGCEGKGTKEGKEAELISLEIAKASPKLRLKLGKGGNIALYVNKGVWWDDICYFS